MQNIRMLELSKFSIFQQRKFCSLFLVVWRTKTEANMCSAYTQPARGLEASGVRLFSSNEWCFLAPFGGEDLYRASI